MVCYAEPVVVNHGELCCASDGESWCVMLNQWLCIMVCYVDPVVVNQECYTEPVVVNHGELCWVVVVNRGVLC